VLDNDEPTSLGILLRHLYVKYDENINEEFYHKRHANFQERGLELTIATAITADKYSALGLVSLAVGSLNAAFSLMAWEELEAELVFKLSRQLYLEERPAKHWDHSKNRWLNLLSST
jgi:hypothetical protein